MTGDLVILEMRFLLARYGVRQVLEALAKVRGQAPEEVEAELTKLESKKAQRKSRPEKTPEELLADFHIADAEQARLVRDLVELYEQKRFLPGLRLVEDFLAERTGQRQKFKSRKIALRALLGVVTSLQKEELRKIRDECALTPSSGDYELLAGAIMGTR